MFNRLALRIAAIEALTPSARLPNGPWPTIAGLRVYDSRQDQLDALDDYDALPQIIVYTDESRAEPYPRGNSRPDHYAVDLTLELMLALRGSVTVTMGDGSQQVQGTVDTPLTDRQHEMLLDVLEGQVRRALEGRADLTPEAAAFRTIAKEIQQINSLPMRDQERTVRFAVRSVTFRCVIASDQWPAPSLTPATLTGLDRLPEPARTFAKGLPAGSSALATMTAAAAMIANPATLVKLAAIDAQAGFDRDTPTNDVTMQVTFP
jgi:hypothetical protein